MEKPVELRQLAKLGTTGGDEYHFHFDFSGVVDREGMKRMVREHIAPELSRALRVNTGGSRASVLKGLRLKEPGAF